MFFDLYQRNSGFTYLHCRDDQDLKKYIKSFPRSHLNHVVASSAVGMALGEIIFLGEAIFGSNPISDFPSYFFAGVLGGAVLGLSGLFSRCKSPFYNRLATDWRALDQALTIRDQKLF